MKMKPLFALFVGLVLVFGCTPKENDGVTPTQPSNVQGIASPLTIIANGEVHTGWGDFIGPDGSTQSVTIANNNPITVVNNYVNVTPTPIIYLQNPYITPAAAPVTYYPAAVTTTIPGGVINGVASAAETYTSYTVSGFTALDVCGYCQQPYPGGNWGVNLLFGNSSGFADYGQHPPVDLSGGNFHRITFYSMVSSGPTTAISFSGSGGSLTPILNTAWAPYTITGLTKLNEVTQFFDIYIVGPPQSSTAPVAYPIESYISPAQWPFTVYVDDVVYQQ
jgi:hypothetical protein